MEGLREKFVYEDTSCEVLCRGPLLKISHTWSWFRENMHVQEKFLKLCFSTNVDIMLETLYSSNGSLAGSGPKPLAWFPCPSTSGKSLMTF